MRNVSPKKDKKKKSMFYYTVLLNDNQATCLPSGLSGQRREATAVVTNSTKHTLSLWNVDVFFFAIIYSCCPSFTPALKVPHIVPRPVHRSPLYASTFCLPCSVTSHNLLLPLRFYQIQVWLLSMLAEWSKPTLPQ